MFPLNNDTLNDAIKRRSIIDITSATIRQVCALAADLENEADEKMVHLEMGNPGLPAENVGLEAEIAALQNGVANIYPNIAGIPELKTWGSRFIKAFLDIEIPAKDVIPTVGSMQ